MCDVIIKIVIIICCLTNLAACDSEWWDEGFSPADHYFRNLFDFGYLGPAAGFRKGDEDDSVVFIRSFKDPLTNINLKITLPPEVKLIKGSLRWKGEMGARSEKRHDLRIHSKTEMKDWSSPITMHVEFIYQGQKIIGEQNVSYECSQKKECPPLWTRNGKVILSTEDIDKEHWLIDQKQEKGEITFVK